MRDELARLLADAAQGRFPPADGGVTILPQPSPRDAGVLDFTAHAVVFADVDPAWIRDRLPPGDLAAPMSPQFLTALCAAMDRRAGPVDLLCVAPPLPGPPPLPLEPEPAADHPRIARALNFRDEIRAWRAEGGVVLVGRGVAGRWEVAVEVDPGRRARGLGRLLIRSARHLIPAGTHIWAQVAPGNVASVRAFLAAGFQPAGGEVLLTAPQS